MRDECWRRKWLCEMSVEEGRAGQWWVCVREILHSWGVSEGTCRSHIFVVNALCALVSNLDIRFRFSYLQHFLYNYIVTRGYLATRKNLICNPIYGISWNNGFRWNMAVKQCVVLSFVCLWFICCRWLKKPKKQTRQLRIQVNAKTSVVLSGFSYFWHSRM